MRLPALPRQRADQHGSREGSGVFSKEGDKMKIEIVKPSVELLLPFNTTPQEYADGQLQLVEMAGRTCYKAEHRITGSSADRDKFIAGLIKRGHLSVLEHGSLTVRLVGSRSMTHQLVRHRLAAYSQESERYCNYTGEKFGDTLQVIRPITIDGATIDLPGGGVNNPDLSYNNYRWDAAMQTAADEYEKLVKGGVPPEDARSVLPNAAKTEIAMTQNLRQWRHVFNRRCDIHAQWEIRSLMFATLALFQTHVFEVFDDFELVPGEPNEGINPINANELRVEIPWSTVGAVPRIKEMRPE